MAALQDSAAYHGDVDCKTDSFGAFRPPERRRLSAEPLQQLPRSETTPLIQPIVIIGAPRSGTTLLGRLLSRHLELAYIEEPRLIWRYGNDRKSDMLTAADARPEVSRYIRAEFTRFLEASGKKRLLEKTPSNSLRLGFVDRVLPDCLFVHIVRDPVESILSIRNYWQQHSRGLPSRKLLQRVRELSIRQWPHYGRELVRRVLPARVSGFVGKPVWGPRIPGIQGLLEELPLIEVCALQWRMCVESARFFGQSLPSDRYLEMRLEELSPESFSNILDFCRLEDSREMRRDFAQIFDPEQVKHRQSLASVNELEIIKRWTESTAHWIGGSQL